jgi:hypothetical protein
MTYLRRLVGPAALVFGCGMAAAHEPPMGTAPAAAAGRHDVRMTTPARLGPGLEIQLLPGRPAGLLLNNTGRESATVLGRHGEACLRIGPDGVAANLRCPTWPEFGRAHGPLAAKADPGEYWVSVSRTPRYSWIDPRTAADESATGAQRWRVPLLVGSRKFMIEGVTEWIPAPPTRKH